MKIMIVHGETGIDLYPHPIEHGLVSALPRFLHGFASALPTFGHEM